MFVEGYEELEIDKIKIYETCGAKDRPSIFNVSYRVVKTGQYWKTEFGIRDGIGNPTELGRKMGIRARDKKISVFSPRGQAIQDYLYRLAWKKARSLMPNGAEIKDDTTYAQAKEARKRLSNTTDH